MSTAPHIDPRSVALKILTGWVDHANQTNNNDAIKTVTQSTSAVPARPGISLRADIVAFSAPSLVARVARR